jgi:hypothetical protein
MAAGSVSCPLSLSGPAGDCSLLPGEAENSAGCPARLWADDATRTSNKDSDFKEPSPDKKAGVVRAEEFFGGGTFVPSKLVIYTALFRLCKVFFRAPFGDCTLD